jgi:hypothetical protein
MVFNNFFKKTTDAQDKKNKEHLDRTRKPNLNYRHDKGSDAVALEHTLKLRRKPGKAPCGI